MEGLPDDAKRKHIRNFLQNFKELIYEGKYYIQDSMKNRQALSDLGLTERQRTEEILSFHASERPMRYPLA
jgi:uncharacterized protein (DUF488 family)